MAKIALFIIENYSFVHTYHVFFIHLSVDGHECFHILAAENNAIMNIRVHVRSQISGVFIYVSRSVISESYDSSILSFVDNSTLFFYSGWTNLHYQQ